MKTTCRLGEIKIQLADQTTSYFFIFENLAELFKLEKNSEAVKLIRKTAREKLEPYYYKRINFDYNSSVVSICTTNAELILVIARIINNLANVILSEEEISLTHKQLTGAVIGIAKV